MTYNGFRFWLGQYPMFALDIKGTSWIMEMSDVQVLMCSGPVTVSWAMGRQGSGDRQLPSLSNVQTTGQQLHTTWAVFPGLRSSYRSTEGLVLVSSSAWRLAEVGLTFQVRLQGGRSWGEAGIEKECRGWGRGQTAWQAVSRSFISSWNAGLRDKSVSLRWNWRCCPVASPLLAFLSLAVQCPTEHVLYW